MSTTAPYAEFTSISCATHRPLVDAFRQRYPNVDLQSSEVLTEGDRVLCSGAVTSYFNLALRLVEKLAGASLFRLADLASHLAVSERTVNRRFKLATGNTPLGYLQSLRIDIAKRLFETTKLHVSVIGERVGYSDLSAFRRLFKRETGLSPREYQQRFARRQRP